MPFIYWVIIAVAAVAVVAFLLYKAGFRMTEIKVKGGIGEAKLERTPSEEAKETGEPQETNPVQGQFLQEASEGGTIKDATIKAPADAGATARQTAKGAGSKLTNTHIELE